MLKKGSDEMIERIFLWQQYGHTVLYNAKPARNGEYHISQSKLKVKVHFIIGNKKNKISKDNRVISHNRPRGTLVKKALASVTNVEYQQFILEKVLPAIEEKWPRNHQQIRLQHHDNAKPHIRNDDPQFQEAIRRSDLHRRIHFA